MAGRAIIVAIGAFFLAVLVVRTAFVEAYADNNPVKAAIVWPGHPSVILESGLTEVGESAAAAQPVNPATVRKMLQTSAKAPLAPEPFLVRGVQAQVEGDNDTALRAFLAARQRDPRSVPARFFLANHYLRTGETRQGLAEISALTRLVPQSLGAIAPQLAMFARMPGGRQEVARLLRDQPQMEPWLLHQLAGNAADADLVLSLWDGRSGDEDRDWQQRLLATLVGTGRFQEARAAWARFDPASARQGELVDPKFLGRARPPFGWALATGPAGVAEGAGDGSLRVLFYGRDDLALATQLLMLKPGMYRLSMRVQGAQPASKSLSWVIRCAETSQELASIPLDSTRGGVLALTFSIPQQGCSAQRLELFGKAPELPEQVDLTISDLRLTRGSA